MGARLDAVLAAAAGTSPPVSCYYGFSEKRIAPAEGAPSDMSGRGDNVVRLGCAEQAAIADELRRYWQHVVDEGVPDHLLGLVQRFTVGVGGQGADAAVAAAQPAQDPAESTIILLADLSGGERKGPP
jgi:Anti-sigma factor NepR